MSRNLKYAAQNKETEKEKQKISTASSILFHFSSEKLSVDLIKSSFGRFFRKEDRPSKQTAEFLTSVFAHTRKNLPP